MSGGSSTHEPMPMSYDPCENPLTSRLPSRIIIRDIERRLVQEVATPGKAFVLGYFFDRDLAIHCAIEIDQGLVSRDEAAVLWVARMQLLEETFRDPLRCRNEKEIVDQPQKELKQVKTRR